MANENQEQVTSTPRRTWDLFALIFAIVFPTIVTLVYFKWLSTYSAETQQSAFSIGKAIQFGFPIVWVLLFHRYKLQRGKNEKSNRVIESNRLGDSPGPSAVEAGAIAQTAGSEIDSSKQSNSSTNDLLIAIGFGLMVVVTMFVAYFGFIAGTPIAESLGEEVRAKVSDLGINKLWKYIALSLFYSICHSFMEEYYWRWFVFDFLKKFTSVPVANIISSLGFMAHHVILLSVYFGWTSPLTYLCSAGVAIGGAFWAWLYDRKGTLKWPWLSHLVVDAGIFSLGYFLVKSLY